MEDLWLVATAQGHLQCFLTEFLVKATRDLPALAAGFFKELVITREQIHDRYQVEASFLQWDRSDIGRPDLVRCPDLLDVHPIGIARMALLARWCRVSD